jgi:predicted double-glycine peptidase/uncharacterized membrane protein
MERFPILTATRQSTEYSCGAAALQAVLSFWGKDLTEQELIRLLHTSPETGTYVGDIARVARELGFSASVREDISLHELHEALKKGESVIICSQAWRSREDSEKSVQEDWEDGHYVVVLGMDRKYVYYQDPFIQRGKGFVTNQRFEQSWHNVRGKTAADTKKQVHLGVFISGTTPPRKHALLQEEFTDADLKRFGPLQLVNVRFEGTLLPYDLMQQVKGVLNRELIRPIAYILIVKDQAGNPGVLEGGDLGEEEAVEIDALFGYLMGLGVGSPGTSGAIPEKQAEGNTLGISEHDLQKMAEELPPDRSILIFVLEHIWVKQLREALTALGGNVISSGLITPERLITWGGGLAGGGQIQDRGSIGKAG